MRPLDGAIRRWDFWIVTALELYGLIAPVAVSALCWVFALWIVRR